MYLTWLTGCALKVSLLGTLNIILVDFYEERCNALLYTYIYRGNFICIFSEAVHYVDMLKNLMRDSYALIIIK